MKKAFTVLVIVALGLAVAQPAMAGRIGQRHVKQDNRIFQGIKSGELTRWEARHLIKEQRRIQRCSQKAWSDGSLTRKERARLGRKQAKASRHIYRLKHNNRERI